MSDLRILVVEDDLFYQTYVNDLLAETGVDIVNASDGEAGLAFAISEKPDLIITDIEIPKIQGFVLLKNLRENPVTKDIPVIMMSGKVEQDLLDRHSKLSIHADGYLMKPFSGQDLVELIRKVMKIELPAGEAVPRESLTDDGPDPEMEASQIPDEVTGPGETPGTGDLAEKVQRDRTAGVMSALVVDDSQYILDIAKDFLKEIGAEVITASDGEGGLNQAIDNIPDIILLDVQMPGLNGFVVCEKLKKDSRTSEIPVILMSAVVDDESFQRHSKLRYHADAYLQKPFMKSELQDLVVSFTSSKIAGAPSVESKTDFLVPSEEETAAAAAVQPEKDRATQEKFIDELKKAREAIESARNREHQIAQELESVRRERDGFEEQLFTLKGSVEGREKDLQDKLTLTTHRHEEVRQEVERLTEENRGLTTQLGEKAPDGETAERLAGLEKQLAEMKNNLDLSMTENEQLHGQLRGTIELDEHKNLVDDLQGRLESATARVDELDALNEQLKLNADQKGEDDKAALHLKEAEARADQADKARGALERDLAAAVAAKNEIEEQVKTILADTRAAEGGGTDPKEQETLRKENQELAVRVSEAESKIKWLAEVEKQLDTVQREADGLREELEGVSRPDESAELLTLKEKLSFTLKRTGVLETENTELAASLAENDEKNAAVLDELSEKAVGLEKELADSRKLLAEETESKMDLEGRLETLSQEKGFLEADLAEVRKLLDQADESDDRIAELEAELRAARKLKEQSEKQVRELRSSATRSDSDDENISKLEDARQELAGRLADVEGERDELADKVAELSAASLEASGEKGESPASPDGRLDQLEKILTQTVVEAQAALKDQKDRELALEDSVESLMRSLEEEKTFFRKERDRWREREDELKDAFEDALRESRRMMGEEAARIYPMHIPRQARPLEVVTGLKKYGIAAGLAVVVVVVFLSGYFVLGRVDRPPVTTAVSSSGQQSVPVARTPEPQAPTPPSMPYLATTGPGESYEMLWRRNTVQSVSEDIMLQATFHTKQELEAAIRYTASKEGWTNERMTKTMGDLARTYDLEESYYVTVFSKNLKGGYPGYADNFERHIAMRDGTGREVRAVLPAELERSKFITSRVSAAGKEMNPVFLYEVGLTVAFPRKELGSSQGGLQLVLYDVGAVPMRVLTWDMDIVSSLHRGSSAPLKRRDS